MKIAVCDDSARDIAQIKSLIDGIKDRLSLEAAYFGSGEEIVAYAEKNRDISLVILDIYMGGMDGIGTARRLREFIPDIMTAFLTTSTDHALDAFDVGALHYLVKPVTAEKLTELLERFYDRTGAPRKAFELKSRTKTYTFLREDVQKILSDNKGVDVYLRGGAPVHIPESFTAIEEQLDESQFLKISRGFIVNMSFILCIDRETCRLKDGTETLISRREKDGIRRRYNDYLFGRHDSRQLGPRRKSPAAASAASGLLAFIPLILKSRSETERADKLFKESRLA